MLKFILKPQISAVRIKDYYYYYYYYIQYDVAADKINQAIRIQGVLKLAVEQLP